MLKNVTVKNQPTPPALATKNDLESEAKREVSAALRGLLADTFALYMKTKNFHWHMSGPHFRDWHLLLDEQADQIYAMTDVLAERGRKLGGLTLHSIGEISRLQRPRTMTVRMSFRMRCWLNCAMIISSSTG